MPATRHVTFSAVLQCITDHNSLGQRPNRMLADNAHLRMPLTLTRLEKRIIALLALMIVLGLIGMSVL